MNNITIEEIAKDLGISVSVLLESNDNNEDKIIEKYLCGELKLLNEDEKQ